MTKKVLILDTSALLGGFKPHLVTQEQYITSGVINEIKSMEAKNNLNLAFTQGKIQVREPSIKSIDRVDKLVFETGDSFSISKVDRSIIALALDIMEEKNHPIILTDDYSIQNVAEMLGIEFDSIMESGIKKQIRWKIICPACKREYPHSKKNVICDVCGTKLKRVIKKKRSID
ncbi:MAG: NOB1 family endonuclease [Candidatus Helarchaeota archaeon]